METFTKKEARALEEFNLIMEVSKIKVESKRITRKMKSLEKKHYEILKIGEEKLARLQYLQLGA